MRVRAGCGVETVAADITEIEAAVAHLGPLAHGTAELAVVLARQGQASGPMPINWTRYQSHACDQGAVAGWVTERMALNGTVTAPSCRVTALFSVTTPDAVPTTWKGRAVGLPSAPMACTATR